jgi:hypothetical protein
VNCNATAKSKNSNGRSVHLALKPHTFRAFAPQSAES